MTYQEKELSEENYINLIKPSVKNMILTSCCKMKYASQIAALLGYKFINNELYEADDVLGMISKYATDNNMDMIISSSDKDMYQLINSNVFIWSHRNKEIIDDEWMRDKYQLTPSQWIELKMLQGDKSDNIPGIQGVGEVTALKLMQQYKSIEGIYHHIGSLKPSLREVLKNGEKYYLQLEN